MAELAAPPLPLATEEVEDDGGAVRWITLVVAIVSAFVVVLDNTVLNVSIPTIQQELHTTLPSLQWVVTGYALTFAALLIIGGRLGDVYGHRRTFIVGLAFFGVGSLLASVAKSVGMLIVGEAVIEGIGASLMLPATLAILSSTFTGKARAAAFAAWGASAGVAAATGPVLGGFLTTNYSWRWSFRINVIVAPLGIIGAVLAMKDAARPLRRVQIDVVGAALVAIGMFGVVFALSEGGVYGWYKPLRRFNIGSTHVLSARAPVSAVPILFVLSLAVLFGFVRWELRRSRTGRDPLIELSHLKIRTYRYGLTTSMVLSLGQLGIGFVLPVFLQEAVHLSAARNGLWLLPSGLAVIVGAQVGARLIGRFGTVAVVRVGMLMYVFGTVFLYRAATLGVTAWTLLPGLVCNGIGIGFAGAQLTAVVLSEIPVESAGVASGANTTMRQVGSALGVSVIGALLVARSASDTVARLKASSLPESLKGQVIAAVHRGGVGGSTGGKLPDAQARIVERAVQQGVTSGARFGIAFAVAGVMLATIMSLLIPSDRPPRVDVLRKD